MSEPSSLLSRPRLLDWGRTEYRIIRNWTPREQREAREKEEASQHEEEDELTQGGYLHDTRDSQPTSLRSLTGGGSEEEATGGGSEEEGTGGGSEEEGTGDGDRGLPETSAPSSSRREHSTPEAVEPLQLSRQTDSGGSVSGVSPQEVTETDEREKEDLGMVPLEGEARLAGSCMLS